MTTDLSWEADWNTMVMDFTLPVTLPTAWGASTSTPTFDTWMSKDGRVVLDSASEATCTDLSVT